MTRTLGATPRTASSGARAASLIVLLPSSDLIAPAGWPATPMPFALLGRKSEMLRAGHAPFDALPQAGETVLIFAARDTLMLHTKVPPVTGPRLRRVLPNIVEEHLIQEAQRCHVAVDPVLPTPEADLRCLAVIDREWFTSVLGRFAAAGHRRVRAVPLIRCIPLPEVTPLAEPEDVASEAEAPVPSIADAVADDTVPAAASVLIVRRQSGQSVDGAFAETETETEEDRSEWVELALRQDSLGLGMSVKAAQLDTTLAELAQRQPLEVYALTLDEDGEPSHAVVPATLAGQRTLPLARVARAALACRFNLCQFELANPGGNHAAAAGLKPWRVSLGLLAASVVVSIVALNVQWWQLRHRRDALETQMTQMVQTAFPGTAMVLGPHEQMTLDLARLRGTAGQLRADDFLTLAASLAHALGPIPSLAIAEIDYNGGSLEVSFKPGTEIDEGGFKGRLATNGLSVEEEDGKWKLRSAPSRPR
jgi:general secretion pathway protein L